VIFTHHRSERPGQSRRIKPNQTKSNLFKPEKVVGRRVDPHKANPKRFAYVKLKFGLALAKEAGGSQRGQAQSNQIKLNQTKSNLPQGGK
jgi:hypothetical protein